MPLEINDGVLYALTPSVSSRGRAATPLVREAGQHSPRPPRLLDRVREANRLRHGSRSTEKSYIGWIRRFILFHGKRHPAQFLSSLAVEGRVAASTQNQALSALLFLYRYVLHQELPWLDDVVRARRPKHLPIVLTRDEVRAVISKLDGTPRLPSYAGLGISPRYGPAAPKVGVTVGVIRPSPDTRRRDMLRDMQQGGDIQFGGIRSYAN